MKAAKPAENPELWLDVVNPIIDLKVLYLKSCHVCFKYRFPQKSILT